VAPTGTGTRGISSLVEDNAVGTALLAPDRAPLSYGGLRDLIASAAARLAERDIGTSDRVVLVVENGPEAATAFLSLACAATCAPLNPAYRRHELDFYLDDLRARAVVVARDLDSPVREAARERGIDVLELEVPPGAPAGIFGLDGPLPDRAEVPADRPDEPALLLHTSGTTSRPKLVPLTQRNLATSARNVAETLSLARDDRCLNVMPLFHIHGIVAALLASLHAGGSVACTPGFHPVRVFEWIHDLEPTWLTAVPTMHQALLARAGESSAATRAHRLRFIRSSSAALPPAVLERLEATFGVPVIEAYGMTEAAHQMASNPLPPGRRRPGSVGTAAGPEIAVLAPDGVELPAGSLGEVAIRGENVFAGYEQNPEANAASFANGWFRTGDEGVLGEDGVLTLHGRIKELINRGGEKIAPLEVDDRLLSHPAVAEAVTFAVPDGRLGEEIAAAVVLADGRSADERALQGFVAETLAPFKVPRKILVLDEIPKGPTGKVKRVALAERLGLSSVRAGPAEHAEPRTAFERWIADIWADLLGVPSIGRDDDFFALGGDSILGAEAVARLRELTGRDDLPLVSIVRAPTVATMARELDGDVAALTRSGPISLRPGSSGQPFFFVHGGDGEVLGFAALARAVGPGCSFYGIRARGIDDGVEPDASIAAMAAAYVEGVRAVQPRGPYRVGGFCVGATVAIEMARALEEAGESVSLVVVDPRLPRPDDVRYRLWLAGRRAAQMRSIRSTLRPVVRSSKRILGRGTPKAGPPAGAGIESAIAHLREEHRPSPCFVPAVAILGDQHAQYDIPAWHLERILPNARTVRIPLPHTPMLQPPGVELLARELRGALQLGDDLA
jgi:acyl-CoA synthetase (AMP-forming)/AMP-acid ligase II